MIDTTRTLPFHPPIAWDALLTFIAARAARGVEHVSDGSYARTVRIDGYAGVIRVTREGGEDDPSPRTRALALHVAPSLVPVLPEIASRITHLFDLDADTRAIEAHLVKADRGLPPIRTMGLRVPGAFDPFELAVRAVLGQQVTVKGASTLMSRLVSAFGEPIQTGEPHLTHITPTPKPIAAASVHEIRAIGLPNARATTILALATAAASGALEITSSAEPAELMRQLRALPGIGPWTAEYVAMRVAHWSDAFPVGDLALRRAAGDISAAELQRIAEQWRPWRAYAAMHLWAMLATRSV